MRKFTVLLSFMMIISWMLPCSVWGSMEEILDPGKLPEKHGIWDVEAGVLYTPIHQWRKNAAVKGNDHNADKPIITTLLASALSGEDERYMERSHGLRETLRNSDGQDPLFSSSRPWYSYLICPCHLPVEGDGG